MYLVIHKYTNSIIISNVQGWDACEILFIELFTDDPTNHQLVAKLSYFLFTSLRIFLLKRS